MADDKARYAEEMIPSNYASWRYCIEEKCGLTLSSQFIESRIKVFENAKNSETQRFDSLYGTPYREQVLSWYQRAATEV